MVAFTVRLLSGATRQFEVAPEGLISDVKAQLEEGLPDFHEVRLYIDETEISGLSLADTGIATGDVVQAVTGASIDKAIAVFQHIGMQMRTIIGHVYTGTTDKPACQEMIKHMPPDLQFIESLEDAVEDRHAHILWKDFALPFFDHDLHRFLELGCLARSQDSFSQTLSRSIELVLRLIGKFGDMAAADTIQNALREAGPQLQGDETRFLQAAQNAVCQIVARRVSKSTETGASTDGQAVQGEAQTAEHAGPHLSTDLENAIRASAIAADVEEGAHVQEALLRSKIDAAERQQLVVLRLTKRNEHVLDVMLKDPRLQQVRAQVEEAGCEILPDWADGAVVLAPLTKQQADEADVQLRPHHIVVVQQNQALVEQVLATIPKRRRPGVQLADAEYLTSSAATKTEKANTPLVKPEAPSYTHSADAWDGFWQVERTFIHCPLPQSPSDSSRMAFSEPWGGDPDAQPTKMRRLLPK